MRQMRELKLREAQYSDPQLLCAQGYNDSNPGQLLQVHVVPPTTQTYDPYGPGSCHITVISRTVAILENLKVSNGQRKGTQEL